MLSGVEKPSITEPLCVIDEGGAQLQITYKKILVLKTRDSQFCHPYLIIYYKVTYAAELEAE